MGCPERGKQASPDLQGLSMKQQKKTHGKKAQEGHPENSEKKKKKSLGGTQKLGTGQKEGKGQKGDAAI